MRIAYFSDTFYPQLNGVVTSILNSSKILAERGHKIKIFTIKTNINKLKLHKNISVVKYTSIDAFRYPGYELVIPRSLHCLNEIKKFKPDAIHIHTPTLLGWEAVVCGRLLNIPTIGTYHTLIPDFLNHSPIPKIGELVIMKKLAWKYTNNFYENCTAVTTPSAAMKRELIKNGLNKKVEVISNGVNLKLFYPRKITNKKFRILYVGRISYEKNIDVVIKAVGEFAKKIKDFEFWIVGSGPDVEKLKHLVKKLKIEKYTRFIGGIDNSKLPEIYSNPGVFVTGSTIETEGIVLLEAMACGLPIIGVNARAIPDLIKNEVNGFIVNPEDYKNMSRVIDVIYCNPDLRKKMAKEAISTAGRYNVERCVERLEKVYHLLLRHSAGK